MAKKLFISYAHADEQLKISLEDHLAIMRRNEIISDWNDRKIILITLDSQPEYYT